MSLSHCDKVARERAADPELHTVAMAAERQVAEPPEVQYLREPYLTQVRAATLEHGPIVAFALGDGPTATSADGTELVLGEEE
jgi:hypothetical protein